MQGTVNWKEVKKLVIDRSRWYRGTGVYSTSLLLRMDGQMCCLGFLCLAAGLEKELIRGVGMPGTINIRLPFMEGIKFPSDMSLDFVREAILINDDDKRLEFLREKTLIALFKKAEIDLSFVDGEENAGRPTLPVPESSGTEV